MQYISWLRLPLFSWWNQIYLSIAKKDDNDYLLYISIVIVQIGRIGESLGHQNDLIPAWYQI